MTKVILRKKGNRGNAVAEYEEQCKKKMAKYLRRQANKKADSMMKLAELFNENR